MNMRRWIGSRGLLLVAVVACVAAVPASSASASKASIKAALKSFSPKIDQAEGKTLTALGTYKTNHQAAPLDAAIGASVKVLKELKSKIATQSAGTPKVKTAKTKLLKGLGAVIVAYEHLGTAFQLHGSDPSAAQAEAQSALAKIKAGRSQLKQAAELLS
jgi:hypothetical protein